MGDAWRLATGTFTRVPVQPPTQVDRRIAGRAMALAPAVSGALACVTGLPLLGIGLLITLAPGRSVAPSAMALGLLAAVLTVAAGAWATRGLHLDGAADTADALGGGRTPTQVQRIARASDIGPFGVITVVLLLGTQVASLTALVSTSALATADATWVWAGLPWAGWVISTVVSRLTAALACIRPPVGRLRAAHSEGLGALVASSVNPWTALGWLLILAVIAGLIALKGSGAVGALLIAMIAVGAASGLGLMVRAARRFSGLTGDVLGAGIEFSATVSLVICAIVATVWQALQASML